MRINDANNDWKEDDGSVLRIVAGIGLSKC